MQAWSTNISDYSAHKVTQTFLYIQLGIDGKLVQLSIEKHSLGSISHEAMEDHGYRCFFQKTRNCCRADARHLFPWPENVGMAVDKELLCFSFILSWMTVFTVFNHVAMGTVTCRELRLRISLPDLWRELCENHSYYMWASCRDWALHSVSFLGNDGKVLPAREEGHA